MVEEFIREKNTSHKLLESRNKNTGKSLMKKLKHPVNKFLRKQVIDINYEDHVKHKVLKNQDKKMTEYHKILEESLNTTYQPIKLSNEMFSKSKKV